MNYVCLIYAPVASSPTPEERQSQMTAYASFTEELQTSGAMTGGMPLQPQETATTVRVRNGERIVTDGPFAETKEWLAGFYAVNCKSLDEALDWAAKIPGAKDGSIEVRPVMDYPDM